jgi:hypothetical protein
LRESIRKKCASSANRSRSPDRNFGSKQQSGRATGWLLSGRWQLGRPRRHQKELVRRGRSIGNPLRPQDLAGPLVRAEHSCERGVAPRSKVAKRAEARRLTFRPLWNDQSMIWTTRRVLRSNRVQRSAEAPVHADPTNARSSRASSSGASSAIWWPLSKPRPRRSGAQGRHTDSTSP